MYLVKRNGRKMIRVQDLLELNEKYKFVDELLLLRFIVGELMRKPNNESNISLDSTHRFVITEARYNNFEDGVILNMLETLKEGAF